MPRKTKMIGRDFQQHGAIVGTFYAPLYGTPAAEIARQINKKLTTPMTFTTQDHPGNDYDQWEELDNGDYRVTLMSRDALTEEAIQESGLDAFVNEKLDELDREIKTGKYPEGSIRRVMVDQMIFGLKSLQIRELFADNQNNHDYGRVPGAAVESKFVEYGIIPKIAHSTVNEKGEETLTFPKDFAEDSGENFFIPRIEQEETAKYSMELFEDAAKKINLAGYNRAFNSYKESFREMQKLGISQPATPEQEEAVRNNVLTHIKELRQELQKAREVDPTDENVWAIYKDKLNQMNNSLYAARGFGTDIEQLNRLEDYLRAGFPPSGYEEYFDLRDDVFDKLGKFNKIENTTIGNEGLVRAGRALYDKLGRLPGSGAGEKERQEWIAGISDAIKTYSEECEKHPLDSLKMKEGVDKSQIQQITSDFKNLTNKFKNALSGYQKDLTQLGQKYPAQRREQFVTLMADMSDDMSRMAKEVKGPAKRGRVPKSLRTAVNRVAEVGTKNRCPEEFARALDQLYTEARKANHRQLINWSKESAAYFGNRFKQGKSWGMVGDVPLDHQQKAMSRGNKSRIDHAMLLFNEKRSAFFGKGEDPTRGKESPEHKALREAAEKFKDCRDKLETARKNPSAKQELEQAEKDYVKQAGIVGEHAAAYIKAKKSPRTTAGKQRLAGATLLYQEAMVALTPYKMRQAAREHYDELGRQAQELDRRIGPDSARTSEKAEKNAALMTEVMSNPEKFREQNRQRRQEQLRNAKEAIQDKPERKAHSVDDMELDIDQIRERNRQRKLRNAKQAIQEKPAQKQTAKDDREVQSGKRPKLEKPARKPVSYDDMEKRFGPAKTEKKPAAKQKSKAAVKEKAKGKESEKELESPVMTDGKG